MTAPCDLTLAEAASRLHAGTMSARQLVDSCLERIERADSTLMAWVTVDREAARNAARTCDEELRGGHRRGPLHGVPVGVKDIICTRGLRTTACSPLFAGFEPEMDADCVDRLRAAGAIVLGKTVCTELATNDPPHTRNPWNHAHTPGGSSSGSAVAVATRMCAGTVDTQTAGDIVRPAAYNGIVGLKPTLGRIRTRGVIPVAWSFDHVGFSARTVEDAALLLQAVDDQSGSQSSDAGRADALDAHERRPPRLGIVRGYFYDHAVNEVRAHVDGVIERFRLAGAHVAEVDLPENLELVHAVHRVVAFTECAAYHHDSFTHRPEDFGPKVRQLIELGLATPAVAYVRARRLCRRFRRTLQQPLDDVEALLTPAAPSAAPGDLTATGSPVLNIPWTLCGFPVIAIPSGTNTGGLPLAIQLVAAPGRDWPLLAVARWCEKVLRTALSAPAPADLVSGS